VQAKNAGHARDDLCDREDFKLFQALVGRQTVDKLEVGESVPTLPERRGVLLAQHLHEGARAIVRAYRSENARQLGPLGLGTRRWHTVDVPQHPTNDTKPPGVHWATAQRGSQRRPRKGLEETTDL
jgi:hypothetical protein